MDKKNKQNILLRTNIWLLGIFLVGFLVIFLFSYYSTNKTSKQAVIRLEELISEGVYQQINAIFTEPVSVSRTMANDLFLKEFMANETEHLEDEAYIEQLRQYLESYKTAYDFDSVFLASAKSGRYYHYNNGLDREIAEGTDDWYDELIESQQEYMLNVDEDYTEDHQVTFFVNCRIDDSNGELLGAVGIGIKLDALILSLEEKDIKDERYDTRVALFNEAGRGQFLFGLMSTVLVFLGILIIVNRIVLRYNERIIRANVSEELEYQRLLNEVSNGIYESVYEMDLTHNCASGESTRLFFESLGLGREVSYDEAIRFIAKTQVKEEFVESYLAIFSSENILKAYENGQTDLLYDFQTTLDGESYYWLRIRARIFYWPSEQSVRMITYRQNIEREKKREDHMLLMAQSDPLTGLYNKAATESHIGDILGQSKVGENRHALLMIDIDKFKSINDTLGHAVGDQAIVSVAKMLKNKFRNTDICGRVGGDEYIVFLRDVPGEKWLEIQVQALVAGLRRELKQDGQPCMMTVSIGAAIYPEAGSNFDELYRHADAALYSSKQNGRDQFTIYNSSGGTDV